MSNLNLEDPELHDRLRRLLALNPPPDPGLPAPVPPDPRVLQAEQLEAQAQPQRGPQGFKENVVAGIGTFLNTLNNNGDYAGMKQRDTENERLREQDLYTRATKLRGEARQSRIDDNAIMQQSNENDLALREQNSTEEYRRAQVANMNKPAPSKGFGTSPQGIYSQDTGDIAHPADPKAAPMTETDEDFADYLKHPELTGKFGADRTGFRRYQSNLQQERSIAVYGNTTAQNPSIIWGDDPENPGKQKPFAYNEQSKSLESIGVTKTPDSAANKKVLAENSQAFIGEIKKISQRLITNPTRFTQMVDALKRGGEAALANDPDYRTYQDYRNSVAASLGIMDQGSRISDYDVKGIYLPMVPDIFKDTEESAKMKWGLIDLKLGVKPPATEGSGTQPQSTTPIEKWERVNGKLQKVPVVK